MVLGEMSQTGFPVNWLDKLVFPSYCSRIDVIEDKTPAWWLESLAQSHAEVEAGKTVPSEPVLDRLRESIARMQARRDEAWVDEGA